MSFDLSGNTMKAVALQAGVSIATVSRVLNNKENVSEDTRKKVIEAMRNIGYLRPQKDVIGLIVPDASNPFFAQLGFAFEQALENNKPRKHLLISSSDGRTDRELEIVEQFKQFGIEGLIYISSGKSSETLLTLLVDRQIPTVVFDRRILTGSLDFVTVNSKQGTLTAVDYLVVHGHERIAYLCGLEGTETAKERYESFREAMGRNNIEIIEDWIFSGDYTPLSGRKCAERLIQIPESYRPTALLAANDLMAIGVMQRLQQEGWGLPKMLSVIGFDNIEWSEWCYPSLTTIAQPTAKLVLKTLELLMWRIKERNERKEVRSSPRHFEIEPVLIQRGSVTVPYSHSVSSNLQVVASDAPDWSK